jgi:hypothetical protein
MDSKAMYGDLSEPILTFVGLASSLPSAGTQESQTSMTTPKLEKAREMSSRWKICPKEQWLELKPVIKRLYVDEGLTFLKVAEYLQDHYEFNPT